MTLLQKIKISNNNAYMNIHEAPYHQTTSLQRQGWIYEEKPCFDEVVQGFWKVYCNPFSKKDSTNLPERAEQDERRRFIRYPITTATIDSSKQPFVFGGAWIDNVRPLRGGEKIAHIHVKMLRDYRHLAYPFFVEFLKSVEGTYAQLYAEWGERSSKDDPTNFLRRWGFEVTKNRMGGQAILNLDDIRQLL